MAIRLDRGDRRVSRRLIIAATALLLVLCSTAHADVKLKPWNQEEVSLLSKQLSEAITSLRTASMNDPSLRDRSMPNARNANELLETLRMLERSCRQLARKLEEGEDREQSLPQARKIGSQVREAQRLARTVMTSQDQWVAIDPAVDLIERLSPYYSEKSPLLPAMRR
jgi:hypothetical protein